MSQYDLSDYLLDKNGNTSMMNFEDILGDFTTDDYEEIVLSDNYKYRVDLLARDYLGNSALYFLILMVNQIKSLDDINSGVTIKMPNANFVNKYYSRLQKEVLP